MTIRLKRPETRRMEFLTLKLGEILAKVDLGE